MATPYFCKKQKHAGKVLLRNTYIQCVPCTTEMSNNKNIGRIINETVSFPNLFQIILIYSYFYLQTIIKYVKFNSRFIDIRRITRNFIFYDKYQNSWFMFSAWKQNNAKPFNQIFDISIWRFLFVNELLRVFPQDVWRSKKMNVQCTFSCVHCWLKKLW